MKTTSPQGNANEASLSLSPGRPRHPALGSRILRLFFVLTLPFTATAQFNYITNNSAIVITGYTGNDTAVVIPDSTNGLPVTSIGAGALYSNYSVRSVVIPPSITNIGTSAFGYCTSLTNVTLLESPTSIGDSAFYHCINLNSAALGGRVTSIGTNAFSECAALTRITIPATASNIASHAFYNCTGLTNVSIANGPTSIGDRAFLWCSGVRSLTIPGSIQDVGECAFMGCSGLADLAISDGVTNIGPGAFEYCDGLTTVTIPGSVASIGTLAFGSCHALTNITVDASNSTYTSANGVLFDHTYTKLIQCPSGKRGGYTVPNSVTIIGDWAFYECSVTTVVVPAGVTDIRQSAFGRCSSLLSIVFNGSAPSNLDSTVFAGTYATIYYFPGAAGWGSPLGGCSVMLWNPCVQTAGSMFGVRTNRFGFVITGTSNLVVVVEGCTDLANPGWLRLRTNTLTGGSSYFSDARWTNYPTRFYRLRWR